MCTIKATCSCGGSFETEGNDVHCGLEFTKFLDAHKKCRKYNKPLELDRKYLSLLMGMLFKPIIDMKDYWGS